MAADELQAAHLLRRAGFGATQSAVAAAAARGLAATVETLLAAGGDAAPLIPLQSEDDYRGKKPLKGIRDLQLLWLERLVETAAPLREKMTLFWHNHFATQQSKVQNPLLMARQNDRFRRQGLGNFGDLLLAVSRDPAMLLFLDNNANHKRSPNENYAREIMELFTLGIGNYTETDVQEAARAFTGWHVHDGEFVLNDRDHDHDSKRFLGHSGDLGGEEIVAILAAHPVTARYLSSKLWTWFAYPNPEASVVDDLAAVYEQTGGDIAAVLRTLFLHEAFYSPRALTGQIKSPAEYVVQTLRLLGLKPGLPVVAALRSMGQELFNPPNVAGWPGGMVWINASTLLARFNFANKLAATVGRPEGDDDIGLDALLELYNVRRPGDMLDHWLAVLGCQQLSAASREALLEYVGEAPTTVKQLVLKHRQTLHALLAAPEYQLN